LFKGCSQLLCHFFVSNIIWQHCFHSYEFVGFDLIFCFAFINLSNYRFHMHFVPCSLIANKIFVYFRLKSFGVHQIFHKISLLVVDDFFVGASICRFCVFFVSVFVVVVVSSANHKFPTTTQFYYQPYICFIKNISYLLPSFR
jgi:hypothetical protein